MAEELEDLQVGRILDQLIRLVSTRQDWPARNEYVRVLRQKHNQLLDDESQAFSEKVEKDLIDFIYTDRKLFQALGVVWCMHIVEYRSNVLAQFELENRDEILSSSEAAERREVIRGSLARGQQLLETTFRKWNQNDYETR